MSQSFYYGTDSELRTSGLQFAAKLVGEAGRYGVTEAQALEMQSVAQAYAQAFAVASTPGTRTRVAVQEKNRTRQLLRDAARRLGNLIIANKAVSDAELVELGLKPRVGRSRIGRPETMPVVHVVSTVGHRMELEIRDTQHEGRGKPAGVAGAQIWIHTGDREPAQEDWVLLASTTRTNTTIELPQSIPPGTPVRICAAWFNNRLQPGELSQSTSAYVQFGGPMRMQSGIRQAA